MRKKYIKIVQMFLRAYKQSNILTITSFTVIVILLCLISYMTPIIADAYLEEVVNNEELRSIIIKPRDGGLDLSTINHLIQARYAYEDQIVLVLKSKRDMAVVADYIESNELGQVIVNITDTSKVKMLEQVMIMTVIIDCLLFILLFIAFLVTVKHYLEEHQDRVKIFIQLGYIPKHITNIFFIELMMYLTAGYVIALVIVAIAVLLKIKVWFISFLPHDLSITFNEMFYFYMVIGLLISSFIIYREADKITSRTRSY